MSEKKITTDQIVDAIVEEVLASKDRIVASVMDFTNKICVEKFGIKESGIVHQIDDLVEYSEGELCVYFDVFDKLLAKSKDKSNSFSMRAVPSHEEKWGEPYVFDYIFKNSNPSTAQAVADDIDKKKEAARKKSLGELGELFAIKALVDAEFDKIRNLNDEHMNEAFADVYCEKGGKKYVISVKARNKYQLDGKLNSRYNLGTNAYEKAEATAKKYDAEPYWMAIQFDEHSYSVYWGSLDCLNGANAIPVNKCETGEIGEILVHEKQHYFDFDFYKNN